ncbi:MAG: hypothetical protein LM577_03770 [Thermoproteaceae archaeon]|nr:hypothetical protein [Thermoproteaceae archaeon]
MFRMDDGVMPRELRIDIIRQGLSELRKRYESCLEAVGKPPLCHAMAAGLLLEMFGSLSQFVMHDAEFKHFILRGADGTLLVYDAESGMCRVVGISEAVKDLLRQPSA